MLRKFVDQMFGHAPDQAPAKKTIAETMAESAPTGSTWIELSEESRANRVPAPLRDEEWWRARLNEGLATWREAATSIPSAPDAGLLVDLLEDSTELVIRQLPSAARDALALCDDQSISHAQLAAQLGKDPALVQALLRTANSALLGAGRQPILRVDSALERIGIVAGRSVVLANCVDGLLSRPGGIYDAMVSDVWSHMIRTGPIARAVAPAFGVDVEECFSVALLHDVGKLVVFDLVSALRVKHRRAVVIPRAWLGSLLQALHEPLGALAALRWNMGPRAALGIGDHHRVMADDYANPMAEVIYAAEKADHATRLGVPLDLEAIFTAGRLSGSPYKVASALGAHWRAA
jgi:HD-like signal output (HDOD) protein